MVSPFFRQVWTVSAVWSNMIGQGMVLSYPSSLLPALQDPSSTIRADLNIASWIASSCGVAGIPGFLMSSLLMDTYGRKNTHIFVILPGIVGWLLIYYAQDIPTLIIGRVLGGMTAGATVSLGAIVIGEYSSPKYRGVFLNLKTASVCLGGMLMHILDHFLSWRTIALLAVIPPTIAICTVLTWYESPAWLASKGEFDKSKKAFFWLRGNSATSIKEIDELIQAQMERISKPKVENSFTDKMTAFINKFTRKDFLKPLIIVVVSATLLETSGRHVFPAYALQIIGQISGDKSQSFYYTLGIDVIITASAVFSSILVKIMKRRTLLFSSGFASFVVLMIVCTYLTFASKYEILNGQLWIPMGMFIVYFILSNLGCSPIPLALLGEIFPLRHRGVGSGVAGICMSLNLMIILQISPYLLVHLKVHGMFFIYGIIMGLALLLLYYILPETKDKTLQDIENYFNHGRYMDDTTDEIEEIKLKMINEQECCVIVQK